MMRAYVHISAFAFVGLILPQVANAQLSAFIDDDTHFVIQGNGEEVAGVDIISPAGGLIPVPDNKAEPFTFLLSNTANQITFGTLGSSVTIDGAVKLGAQWDPLVNDVNTTFAVGIGPVPVDLPLAFEPCTENCPVPTLKSSVNSDLNLVLHGRGQTLSDITFRSPSGSLVSSSPAPFAEFATNTANEVTLASPGSQVTIEGNVTLGVSWSESRFTRDIEYSYQLFDEDDIIPTNGPYTIDKSDYDYRLPRLPQLQVRVNDDDHVVISGTEHPVTALTLSSTVGSLIPNDDPGPFAGYRENTSSSIVFQIDDSLFVENEIVLPVKWDWRKQKSLRVDYDLAGELSDGGYKLPESRFPDVPRPGEEPLLITLDANNNFVLTGIGQNVNGIEFKSPAGLLKTSSEETSAPFPVGLSNTPENITLGVLGSVEMNGSFVMDFGIDDPSLIDQIEINVGYGQNIQPNPANIECERCDFPSVLVSEERGLVLENFDGPVTQLTFSSKFGGLDGIELPDGLSLVSSSPTEVVISDPEGFDAADMQGLEILWSSNFDSQVFVSFALLDGTSFGPLPLQTGTPAIPEPSSISLAVFGIGLLVLMRRRSTR